MSDGAIALVPVGLVLAAPIVAVAGAGAAVYYSAKAVADAVHNARLAHARSRVAAERRRREELGAQAARLRYPLPGVPGSDPHGTAELNLLADRLSTENDRLSGELAAEQLKLNQLSTRLRSLEGRRETLAGWVHDAQLVLETDMERPNDSRWTAVQQAEQQLATVTRTITAMETGLRSARRERERHATRGLWGTIAMPPAAELDRDPQSSSERWRAPLRTALERGLQDATIGDELPSGVAAAFEAIEAATDEVTVRVQVEAAIAALGERSTHEAVVRHTLRTLEQLANEAEGSENYVVLADCDVFRAEFDDVRQRLGAADLDVWAKKRFRAVERLLRESERALAEHLAERSKKRRHELATEAEQAMTAIMADMDYIHVEMEIGQPRNGHLFIERSQAGKPSHGRVVSVDSNGLLQTYTVALRDSSVESDGAACARHVAIENDKILPALRRRMAGSGLEGIEVIHDHRAEIDSHVLTSSQRQQIARQLESEHTAGHENERSLP